MTKDLTPKDNLNTDFNVLFPPTLDQSSILIGCRRSDYSASLIARAVEDCNAQVLNLNVTAIPSDEAEVVVSLRVNHRNPQAIIRSLQRYGYEVLDVIWASDDSLESMRSRANELLRYLEI